MNPTDTDRRLAAIHKRLQRATPGPWEAHRDSDTHYGDASMVTSQPRSCSVAHGIEEHPDAEFIAAAHVDIAYLLSLVARLTSPTPLSSHDSVSPDSAPGAGDVGGLGTLLAQLGSVQRIPVLIDIVDDADPDECPTGMRTRATIYGPTELGRLLPGAAVIEVSTPPRKS